jgi:DNA-binding NarL/FixJ family response regulator
MRVLLISSPAFDSNCLQQAFSCDNACDVIFQDARGITAGLAQLRDQAYDAVLIIHEPVELNALEMLDAIRTGSSEQQPILVLGQLPDSELTSLCFESGADGYVCLGTTTARDLVWHVARASERQRLLEENHRLRRANKNQISMELDEAERLLEQQRELLACELPAPEKGDSWPAPEAAWMSHYRDLLRTYVVMGSGNLADELCDLAQFLLRSQVTAEETLRGHLQVLHETVQELGARSARHVMNRGALLVLEVLLHLADGYRREFDAPGFRRTDPLESEPAERAANPIP